MYYAIRISKKFMSNIIKKSFHLSSVFSDALPTSNWKTNEIKIAMSLFSYLERYKIYLPDYDTQEEIIKLLSEIPLEYKISKKEFLSITDINIVHFSREIKNIVETLAKKTFNLPHPIETHKDSRESISWFSKVTYSAQASELILKINSDALESLVSFVKYSKIKYEYLMPLKSTYSLYTYLFLKIIKDISRNKNKRHEKILTKELKQKLGLADKYSSIQKFREKVLDVVKKEINEHTDITFDYDLEKEGRAYKYINLYFDYKKQTVIETPKKDPSEKSDPFGFNEVISDPDNYETSIFEETLFSWGIRVKKIAEIENTYSLNSISEAIDETEKADSIGKIKTTKAAFFLGTLANKQIVEDEMHDRDINAIQEMEEKAYKQRLIAEKEDAFQALQSVINLYEEEFSKLLTAYSMGAKLEISDNLMIELDKMNSVDFEQFANYKTSQAVLDKGFYDMKTQKNVRPNMYNFMSVITTVK